MKKRRPSIPVDIQTSSSLGQIFTNHDAAKAYKSKRLNSIIDGDSRKLRVIFMNQTQQPLILCWVDGTGGLHHYYKLKPCTRLIMGLGRDETNVSFKDTHIENTRIGHSFVFGTCADDNGNQNDNQQQDDQHQHQHQDQNSKRIGDIIAGYRPTNTYHAITNSSKGSSDGDLDDETCVHMVTISTCEYTQKWRRPFSKSARRRFQMDVSKVKIDHTPLDTTNKVYEDTLIGSWKCKCEPGLFTSSSSSSPGSNKKNQNQRLLAKQIQKRLECDLLAASKKLPTHACKILKENTPIWINKSQKYGPACAPVSGRGMCFHPESKWLTQNGMSPKKHGGVELFEADKYLDDADLWYGKGGVMIHELSHAYHWKVIKDGYENEEIKKCYEEAMREKLYDAVEVHNGEGGKDICRAYACTDPMEYFAELSTAFLGGVDEEEDLEFNKWYPFNRKQIKEHDPRAFDMLQKMWYGYGYGVDSDEQCDIPEEAKVDNL